MVVAMRQHARKAIEAIRKIIELGINRGAIAPGRDLGQRGAEVLLVAEALLVAEMTTAKPLVAEASGDVCHDGCIGLSPLDLPRLPPGTVTAGRPRNTRRPVSDPGTGP